MIKLLTYISGVIAFLTVVTICHVFILYLMAHPMPFKITALVVMIVFFYKGLRWAVRKFLYEDYIEDSFKSKSIKE